MTEQRIENHILKTELLDIDSLIPLQGAGWEVRRIKESLEKINALMSDMKHKPGTSHTTGIGDKT